MWLRCVTCATLLVVLNWMAPQWRSHGGVDRTLPAFQYIERLRYSRSAAQICVGMYLYARPKSSTYREHRYAEWYQGDQQL